MLDFYTIVTIFCQKKSAETSDSSLNWSLIQMFMALECKNAEFAKCVSPVNMTSNIWADLAKDQHKIGILQ